jgi:hypothetical protein
MKVIVTNIPKDKFQHIQADICKVLFSNGIQVDELETIILEDGISSQFQGFEFEIKIDHNKAAQIVHSSTGA